jgi:hypothetical protein
MSLTRSLIPQQHRPILDQLLIRLGLRQGQAFVHILQQEEDYRDEESPINRALQIAIRNLEAMVASLIDEEFFLILNLVFALYGSDLRGSLKSLEQDLDEHATESLRKMLTYCSRLRPRHAHAGRTQDGSRSRPFPHRGRATDTAADR